jgi:hypothetical protein
MSLSGLYHDGKIDSLGIWNRFLPNSELNQIYNAGVEASGREWPFTTFEDFRSRHPTSGNGPL